MANHITKNSINVSKETIRKEGGVVILSLREYEELRERSIPTYHLEGKDAEKLDRLIGEGLEDYKNGKCKTIESLSDLD
ncbi:MAG: hypothetical protein A2V72_02060 [Candidatus Nealsonbacteria bacterium RBG_13_37_56]|uniref:Prevent-host-death protein n=1 Tax=Candidatus Nealsonbacteria bacterium RBG_13_37_56 TaxID=1801661 RepID=A0A1G2DWY3_9BACT|nr:MAG: hypothetical protein A2V72_02060 [Candidatus Nealsonbacteria bacterium RBG_13_37_56]